MNNFVFLLIASCCFLFMESMVAFQPRASSIVLRLIHHQQQRALQMQRVVDIQEHANRDFSSLQEWAQSCGVQMNEGFELLSDDGEDWSVYTSQEIPAESPVLYIPSSLVLCSTGVESDLGGNLEAAENALQSEGSDDRMPLFRLIVKILTEIENGYESNYLAWLNSLPRRFYNGVSMTDACFDCLPPYAASVALNERTTFEAFLNAMRQGYLELSDETLYDDNLLQWAYNVALTRHQELWTSDGVRTKRISPMADMLNHATESNTMIQYDEEGNCWVTAKETIPAGSPLIISLTKDPTNPTLLFAKYGFLCDDSSAIFCKAIHLQSEIKSLGYDYSELLFDTQTGAIAPKVWDIFLYNYLQDDVENSEAFWNACQTDDEETKQAYHEHYFPCTLDGLQQYVNSMLQDFDSLNARARSYDVNMHPRVPIIVAHNLLVKNTFEKVQDQLISMTT